MNRRLFIKNVVKSASIVAIGSVAIGKSTDTEDDGEYVATFQLPAYPESHKISEATGCLNRTAIAGIPPGQLRLVHWRADRNPDGWDMRLNFSRRQPGHGYFQNPVTGKYSLLVMKDSGQPVFRSVEFRDIPGLSGARIVKV